MRKNESAGDREYAGNGGKRAAGSVGRSVSGAGRNAGSERAVAEAGRNAESERTVTGAGRIAVTGLAVIVVAAMFLLTGCGVGGGAFPADRSVIYIAKDGGIYTALCGTYDEAKDYYSEEELTARVEEEVAAYNAEHPADARQARSTGAGQTDARQTRVRQAGSEWMGLRRQDEAVAVEKVHLGDGTASVVLRYSDAADLIDFTEASQDVDNHTEKLSVTTIGEGLPKDADAGEKWIDAKRNDPVTPEQIRRRIDLHLIAVAGPVTVQTEKRILYYSGAVSLLDPYTAQVTDGDAYIVYK